MLLRRNPFASCLSLLIFCSLLFGCGRSESVDSELLDYRASCPAWAAGQNYDVGAKVIYNGQGYVAVHANPGYDPVISHWFWSPTADCNSTGTSNFPAWSAGQNYNAGDKVTSNGRCFNAVHPNPGYDPHISTWFWSEIPCKSGPIDNTSGSSLSGILSRDKFNQLFPGRNAFYTYEGLAGAVDSLQRFAKEGGNEVRKREVAALLANVSHETSDLVHVEEINKDLYCLAGQWPCAAGKRYYGRGPIQLSWNFNYGPAGQYLGLDLLNNPDLVSQNSEVAWKTAIWFWMTSTGAGSMTAHNAIVSGAGFGETIRSINGAMECNGRNPAQVQSRIDRFHRYTRELGVSPGNNLGC